MTQAEIIRQARGKLSMNKFAKILGVNPSSVSLWESGQRNPRRIVLKLIEELKKQGGLK